jgi:hypothetical protein
MEPGGQAPQPVHVGLIHARQWVRLLQQGEVDDVLEKLDPVLVNKCRKVIKVTLVNSHFLRAILQKNSSE